MPYTNQLLDFEHEADRKAEALNIWHLPLRSVLSHFYLTADYAWSGGRFIAEKSPDPQKAATIISRLSYLATFLHTCSLQIGNDIDDALNVVTAEHKQSFFDALNYAHFCEIMPEVRNGRYIVEAHHEGYRLIHHNRSYSQAEEHDIILTELAMPFENNRSTVRHDAFARLIAEWPLVSNSGDFIQVLIDARDHYLSAIREDALLSTDAYSRGFGFSRQEYQRVRASLLSIADFCIGMADAAEYQWHLESTVQRRYHWERESREWSAPLLRKNFILATTMKLANVKLDVVNRAMNYLCIDASSGDFGIAGDGFLPPFICLGNSLLFSPYTVKTMMPERNLLYVSNKRDREIFDREISPHMEPNLINQAAEIFERIPGVEVKRNVNWSAGEIDLLVRQKSHNVAMQVQAKATLAPQGARMTRQVESQALNGIDQLNRFSDLSEEDRNRVCAVAFGGEVVALEWVSGLLVRAGLGTERAWSAVGGVAIFNPLLLRGSVEEVCVDGKASIAALLGVTHGLVRRLVARAVKCWRKGTISVFGTEVEVPLLDLNYEEIDEIRQSLGGEDE